VTSARTAIIGDNCVDAYVSPPLGAAVGGNGVNVAVHLALAGHGADYFGAVGQDGAGAWIRDSLRRAGVGVDHLVEVPGRTSVTQVAVHGNEREFLSYERGVGDDYVLQDIDAVTLRVLAGYARIHVVRLASSVMSGLMAVLDVPISCDLGPDWAVDAVRGLDVAFASAEGSERSRAADIARVLVEGGAKVAVVTCGAAGSVCYDGRRSIALGAVNCGVIDTLGAGDSFIAAFLAGRLENTELEACVQRGATLAAVTCGHLGGWPQELVPLEAVL